MGFSDAWVKKFGGRVEVFEIAEDEQLIGCELDEINPEYDGGDNDYFKSVTWIKIKLTD